MFGPVIERLEYLPDTGQWTIDQNHLFFPLPNPWTSICVYPWFVNQCVDGTPIQRQQLMINALYDGPYAKNEESEAVTFLSDAMVPQNTGVPFSCSNSTDPSTWNWGGTATDTGSNISTSPTLLNYWTLVGWSWDLRPSP